VPEGDTIHRAADRLRAALAEQTIVRAASSLPALAARFRARRVAGSVVTAVEAQGKHLLVRFSREGRETAVLHTHLGMTGSWMVAAAGRARFDVARARVVLETEGAVAVCLSAPTVELLDPAEAAKHAGLRRLGQDVIDASFDPTTARDLMKTRPELAIADALLDQTLLAGVGNIYKSEALFRARVNPFRTVGSLDDATLDAVIDAAVRLLRANAKTGPRRTNTLGMHGRYWVYGRSGQACLHCGTRVMSAPQGGRLTYWCPNCQP
jgi:endonuclease-8